MPQTQEIQNEISTQAGQTRPEPQPFVVSPRLEQSVVADMRPLIIPLGLGPAAFRKEAGGTAEG